jgi:hypothetical protein
MIGSGGSATACHIGTGYIPSSSGINASQNSATVLFCAESSNIGGGFQLAANDGSNTTWMAPLYNGPAVAGYTTVNESFNTSTFSTSNIQGSWVLARTWATLETLYVNGTSVATPNTTSTGLPTVELYVLARNNNGTEDLNSENTVTIGYAGYAPGWNSTQVANFRSIMNTLMTAFGASGC